MKKQLTASFALPAMLFLSCALIGCATTIPATDTEPPTVTIIMTGPGFRYQCATASCPDTPKVSAVISGPNEIFIPLNRLGDGVVTLTVIVGDSGGVREAGMTLVFLDYSIVENPDHALIEDLDRDHKLVHIFGRRSDPKTGLGFSIKIRLEPTVRNAGGILAYGLDFGGASGPANYRESRVNYIQVVDPE